MKKTGFFHKLFNAYPVPTKPQPTTFYLPQGIYVDVLEDDFEFPIGEKAYANYETAKTKCQDGCEPLKIELVF